MSKIIVYFSRAGAVIMQYTGLSEYTENTPPTFVCVGRNDGIANWRTALGLARQQPRRVG